MRARSGSDEAPSDAFAPVHGPVTEGAPRVDSVRERSSTPIPQPSQITSITRAWGRADSRVVRDAASRGRSGRSDETTAASDAQYRDLLENAVEGVFRTTASGRTLSINTAGARMFGYDSPAEMLSWVTNESTAWLEPQRRSEFVDSVCAHGSVSDFEFQIRRRDGSIRWLSISAHAIRDPRIPEPCLEGMIVDVTRRRHAEEELKESRELHEALFAHIVEGVTYCEMVFDDAGLPIDFVHLEVNRAFEELTGLVDVAGRRITEVVPGIRVTNPDLFAVCGRVTRTGAPEHFETFLPGLGRRFAISAFRPNPGHFAAVFQVVTGGPREVEAEPASGQHVRAVVDDLAEGVAVQDVQGTIVASNAAARSILGLVVDDVTGRTFSDPNRHVVWTDGSVARSEDHPGTVARTTGRPVTGVMMGVRDISGATRWLNVSALPLRDPTDATVTGAVISLSDITGARPSGESSPSDAIVRRSLDAMLDPFGDEQYRGLQPSLVWAMEQQMHILDSATRLSPEPRAAAVRCALALRQSLTEMGAIVSDLRPPARQAGRLVSQRLSGGVSSLRTSPGELTERECEVARLVAQGHDNRTICDELYLAEVTVKKHVQRIMSKLGATNRTQAAIIAVRLGLDGEPASLDG